MKEQHYQRNSKKLIGLSYLQYWCSYGILFCFWCCITWY